MLYLTPKEVMTKRSTLVFLDEILENPPNQVDLGVDIVNEKSDQISKWPDLIPFDQIHLIESLSILGQVTNGGPFER